MASEQEVAYHRSFLSRNYVHQLAADIKASGKQRSDEEIAEIRQDDPEGFEEARKALAILLKVQYSPAQTVNLSSGDVGDRYKYYDGVPSDAQVAEYLRPQYPPQGAVNNPTTGVIGIPDPILGFVYAFRNGKGLLRTSIAYKTDQQFFAFATEWENLYSTLTSPYRTSYEPGFQFTPIVDTSWQVVEYYGEVSGVGSTFLVPAGSIQLMEDFWLETEIEDLFAHGVPIMVGSAGAPPAGWESWNGWRQQVYGVRTTVDGQVVAVTYLKNVDGLDATWSPIDLLFMVDDIIEVARLAVAVAQLGVVMVKTIGGAGGRGLLRMILRGATALEGRRLLKEVEKDLANEGAKLVLDTTKAAAKVPGRDLTAEAMEKLVRQKWSQNTSWLRGLRDAQKLTGSNKLEAVRAALQDMKKYYGKAAQVVSEGAGQGGHVIEGGVGWMRHSETGELVLAIERQLLRDPDVLYSQVVHDVAFDLVREAGGVPGFQLNESVRFSATDMLEGFIKEGEAYIQSFRNVVYQQAEP
jgi:hypothetical protein